LFLVVGRLFGEEIGVADVAWTAVAIGGVGVVVFGGHATTGSSLRGNLLATGALFTWAWYFVASKRARRHLGALEYQSAMTLIAATVATPIAVLSGERLSLLGHRPSSWLWIGLIVIGGGGGHLLMNYAHASVRLTITSLLTLSTPVLAAAGAAVFLHEPLRVVQGAGMALVIAALAIVITRRSRAEALLAAEEGLAEPR